MAKTASGNERIRALNDTGVVFTVRADKQGGKRRVRLDGTEFVRRFMMHVLPAGIKRVPHYGVLAAACKGIKLATARAALQMPAFNAQAVECAKEFMARAARIDVALCPCCKVGRLHVAEILKGVARLLAPGADATVVPHTQGPP